MTDTSRSRCADNGYLCHIDVTILCIHRRQGLDVLSGLIRGTVAQGGPARSPAHSGQAGSQASHVFDLKRARYLTSCSIVT
jgi:hypothetical protein